MIEINEWYNDWDFYWFSQITNFAAMIRGYRKLTQNQWGSTHPWG